MFELNCTIVRPFNIYGSGQPETFLIPEIIEQLRGGNQIIVNDLSPRRDYIHVEDLSRLLIKTVTTKHNGIINAGTGVSTSVEELISVIQEVNGSDLKVVSRNQERSNEISNTVADITRAFEVYEWKPEISLRNGIQLLLAEREV